MNNEQQRPQLVRFLVAELLKLDGKCLDEMADVNSVAEALARALEARAQKTVCECCGSSYRRTTEEP